MSFLNFWLFCWVLLCVSIGALPSGLRAIPGRIEAVGRWFTTRDDEWLQLWGLIALPAVLLEFGRHLPWVAIRALPEFAVATLGVAAVWAIKRNWRERGFSHISAPDHTLVRRVMAAALLFDVALALIWIGGQWF